ncbi:MAG TPA: hypothetical protein VK518_16690 [Puia sp.]|nr:hypothetical protein [Puia sp.]
MQSLKRFQKASFFLLLFSLNQAKGQPWLPAGPTIPAGTSIYNNNAGNVGIGTTTPDKLLTVNGVTHIGNDLVLTRTDNGTAASIVLDNVGTKSLYIQKIGGGNIDVINLLGNSIGITGNAAIGQPALGPGVTKFSVWTNTSGDGVFINNDGSGYGGSSGFIKIHGPSLPAGGWNNITASGDAGIVYGTANTTVTNNGFVIAPYMAATTGLRIDKLGNVGICATDTKGYQLAVNGSAVFTKVVVKPVGLWPDYVFGSKYRLPSLHSVEKFIRTYQHLPGLPSADRVDKQGVDIGKNQATLLKKIEELTMYTIDQDKKLESQQEQIDELKTLVKKLLAKQ